MRPSGGPDPARQRRFGRGERTSADRRSPEVAWHRQARYEGNRDRLSAPQERPPHLVRRQLVDAVLGDEPGATIAHADADDSPCNGSCCHDGALPRTARECFVHFCERCHPVRHPRPRGCRYGPGDRWHSPFQEPTLVQAQEFGSQDFTRAPPSSGSRKAFAASVTSSSVRQGSSSSSAMRAYGLAQATGGA